MVKCLGQYWVVFGNRRLKALKEFVRISQRQVRMLCIVHDLEGRRRSVPMDLLAKFLDATTTENGGVSASFRRFG